MKIYNIFVLCLVLIAGCKNSNDNDTIIVSANTSTCFSGDSIRDCLQIKLDNPDAAWIVLKDTISGFIYQAGYEYKLKVESDIPVDTILKNGIGHLKMSKMIAKKNKKVPFLPLHNYFIRNDVKEIDPIIKSEKELKNILGLATTMSKSGIPTPVDFNKSFVVLIAKKETNKETEIMVEDISENWEGELEINYKVLIGNEITYTIRPMLAIAIDKSYLKKIKLNEKEIAISTNFIIGNYEGLLPCADCPGIKEKIMLNADHTFVMLSTYLERNGEKPYIDRGNYEIKSGKLILKMKDNNFQFDIGNGYIEQLDGDGNKIESDLNFKLNKVN